jgi:hypothetical protein
MAKKFEDEWGEFEINVGPIGVGIFGPYRVVKYRRTDDLHIIKMELNPEVKKDQIKVRLVEPGILEIEWPRIRGEAQDIKVE